MNPSSRDKSALTNGSTSDGPRYGQITECELCQNERHCTDRCGMLTCSACQDDFLP